jgi:hypothetical protein
MTLNQICREFKLDLFKLVLRYSASEAKEQGVQMASQGFEDVLADHLAVTPVLAIVCGPKSLTNKVSEALY